MLGFIWSDFFPDFTDLVKWLHDAIMPIFSSIWQFLVTTFTGIATTVYAAIFAVVSPILSPIVSALVVLSPYFAFVNAWIPLDVFANCCVAYSTFWVAWNTYIIAKSWIPTLSGS